VGQNYGADEQNHEPLADKKRIARLLQKHAGIHSGLIARVADDYLTGEVAPEKPHDRTGESAEPNP
jgi:hypothetical protein